MLWYCRFKWLPGTTTEEVRRRVSRQHAAGTNHPERIRGWYNLAGGGAGFMLIEAAEPRELTEILEPYMDLVSWDVHAVYELPYGEVIAHFERMIEEASRQAPVGEAEPAPALAEVPGADVVSEGLATEGLDWAESFE